MNFRFVRRGLKSRSCVPLVKAHVSSIVCNVFAVEPLSTPISVALSATINPVNPCSIPNVIGNVFEEGTVDTESNAEQGARRRLNVLQSGPWIGWKRALFQLNTRRRLQPPSQEMPDVLPSCCLIEVKYKILGYPTLSLESGANEKWKQQFGIIDQWSKQLGTLMTSSRRAMDLGDFLQTSSVRLGS